MLKKVIAALSKIFSTLDWLTSSSLLTFVFIFILAFGIRAYSSRHDLYLLPRPDRELGAIARSLVDTGQFANPYMLETGPTAHLPPIPPMIVALVYYLFGNTWQAGYVYVGFIFIINSVVCAMTPWMAGKFGLSEGAGFTGGIASAFMVESELSTHGEGLAGVFLGLMLAAFLKRSSSQKNSLFSSLMLGLGIGVSFHVQPVLLLVFLGCLAFEIGWHKVKRKLVLTAMLTLGVMLACVPWAWRNYNVFHDFFFIRDNLGLELRMGNSPGAAATFEEMDKAGYRYKHPRVDLPEARKVKELGEMEYMRDALNESLAWIQENPLEFFKLTFMRFVHFWFGPLLLSPTSGVMSALTILAMLGIRRVFPSLMLPQQIILLTPLLVYPLIYYFVPYAPRYRTPIDWILLMLAGVEVWYWLSTHSPKLVGINAPGASR
jgi:hypothetical protein